jgi:hypothetical protein
VGEGPPTSELSIAPFPGAANAGESWMLHLLPYLEDNDYQKMWGKYAPPAGGAGVLVKPYLCPSDMDADKYWPNSLNQHRFSPSDVTDGTSNRIILDEELSGTDWSENGKGWGGLKSVLEDGSVRSIRFDGMKANQGSPAGLANYFTSFYRILFGPREPAKGEENAATVEPRRETAEDSSPDAAAALPVEPIDTEGAEREPITSEPPCPAPRTPTLAWLRDFGLLDELRKLADGDTDAGVREAAEQALDAIAKQEMLPLESPRSPFPPAP